MYCVYKNLFTFLKNNNFYLNNFYFFNHFNHILMLNFTNFSCLDINTNLKFSTKFKYNKDFSIFKHLNYINRTVKFKSSNYRINQMRFIGWHTKNKIYVLNNNIYFFFKKLVNVFHSLIKFNKNFMVLDKSYKNIFPLYNYIFSFKHLLKYKKYFFVDIKYFTFNNWWYYYSKFSKKFNVSFLVILDFNYYSKFFKNIRKSNLPTSSLVPIGNYNPLIDYPIYVSDYNSLEKFVFLNFIVQNFLVFYNLNNLSKKTKFLMIFYNFAKNSI